jgi:hypothetical protein
MPSTVAPKIMYIARSASGNMSIPMSRKMLQAIDDAHWQRDYRALRLIKARDSACMGAQIYLEQQDRRT